MEREKYIFLRERVIEAHAAGNQYRHYLRLLELAFKHCTDRQYDDLAAHLVDREQRGLWDQESGRLVRYPADGPEPTRPGYVYVLKAENGLFKIGRAKVLDARITQIGIQVPFAIELYHAIRCGDCVQSEALIHAKFRSQRVKGEWFRLTEDDLEWIRRCAGW